MRRRLEGRFARLAVGPAVLLVVLGQALGAPTEGSDLSARQLENGDRLAREGRVDQALAAWKDVAASWPDSREAPLALDRWATSLYPGDGTDTPSGAQRVPR